MSQYFIQSRTGQEGPFTLEELSKTPINPDTLVWYKGINDWTPAGKIEALNSLFRGAPAAPSLETFMAPRYDDLKRRFNLSLFQWAGIGVLVISAFIYFARSGDASSTSPNYTVPMSDSAAIAAAEAVTEKKRVMSELAAKNINYRNNWSRFIKADAGNFKTNTFGGIYQLEAIVQNKTDYPLDEVSISISYIKDNGGTHKTENITIYNVPAHGEASVPAPDSNRGKSVKMEVTKIKAKRMNFLYRPDIRVEGKDDPYYKVN